MKPTLKNNKGNMLVLVCVALPVFIGIAGICLDGSLAIYYQTKLMAATKFAAISASSHNYVVSGKTVINATQDQAEAALKENFGAAKLRSFSINQSSKNKCTLVAETEVNFVFVKIFGVNSKKISESYTVTRK
ncbi:TadE/TadG family type IV pilus assembly protein [Clostridium saccharoperbutylacetonicum]|uniref:TadE/TadG family type IV pilus assembly protein n=1 Tax=Clostridium saccharoperbutylacetonicum TaxID=36745 RepID=UPI0039E7BB59